MSNSTLNEEQQNFLNNHFFGMLTVQRPDGYPSTNPVSYRWTGETIQISTLKSRYKYKCILKNDQVAFCVQSATNHMAYVEIRGRATVEDDPERLLLKALFAEADFGEPPEDMDAPGDMRVALTITPEQVSSPKLYEGRFDT